MTPEEFAADPFCHSCGMALYLVDGCEWADDPADNLCHDCALKEVVLCRAALRERDAAWAAAVKASGLMLSPDSDNEAWRPLRALLEEAGK